MILKYLRQSVITLLGAILMSSCLGSESVDYDASKDAQIYSFSLSSKTDTSLYLSDTKFSIDQLNGKIFNRDSLPYLFNVDSVLLEISGKTTSSFTNVVLALKDKDSTFIWNGKDSISFHRLSSIETTAEDQNTKMTYQISINIHQQDPYIITWNQIAGNYLQPPVEQQKTISYNGNFITYYYSNGILKAAVSASDSAAEWEPAVVAGLPNNISLSSFVSLPDAEGTMLFVLGDDGDVYSSSDGLAWSNVNFEYPVIAIYGAMSTTSGDMVILAAADIDSEIYFITTIDFSAYNKKNVVGEDMPVENFSSIGFSKPSIYGGNYIALFGGNSMSGDTNKEVWILKEESNNINVIHQEPETASGKPIDVITASLFYYDKKVYMLVYDGYENILYNSDYGINWSSGGENQVVPEGFALRKNATVLTDANDYIWIFGGKSGRDIELVDVWRGRLNKLAK